MRTPPLPTPVGTEFTTASTVENTYRVPREFDDKPKKNTSSATLPTQIVSSTSDSSSPTTIPDLSDSTRSRSISLAVAITIALPIVIVLLSCGFWFHRRGRRRAREQTEARREQDARNVFPNMPLRQVYVNGSEGVTLTMVPDIRGRGSGSETLDAGLSRSGSSASTVIGDSGESVQSEYVYPIAHLPGRVARRTADANALTPCLHSEPPVVQQGQLRTLDAVEEEELPEYRPLE